MMALPSPHGLRSWAKQNLIDVHILGLAQRFSHDTDACLGRAIHRADKVTAEQVADLRSGKPMQAPPLDLLLWARIGVGVAGLIVLLIPHALVRRRRRPPKRATH